MTECNIPSPPLAEGQLGIMSGREGAAAAAAEGQPIGRHKARPLRCRTAVLLPRCSFLTIMVRSAMLDVYWRGNVYNARCTCVRSQFRA
jgi:hypothetical protein